MSRSYASFNWALLLLAGVMVSSAAAQKSNFSGAWKLNLSKSFTAGDHPSRDYQLTKIIVQNGNEFTITDVALHQAIVNIPIPDSTTTTMLVADGKERENKGVSPFPGIPAPTLMASVEWQGNTLSINERGERGFATVDHRRYYLSDDGAELVELVESHSTFEDIEQRLVFDKQP